jgi:CubicO group peptidase (beta-lactamase class C family)
MDHKGAVSFRPVARVFVALLLAVGCSGDAVAPAATPWTPTPSPGDLPVASAHSENLDGGSLIKLTHWIRDTPNLPIFSVLISRNGKLVFELYTPGLDRPQAHYMMSVSKSVLSALVGKAVSMGAIPSTDTPLSELLPRALFASSADVSRFGSLGLRHAMGMSALSVTDYPRDTSRAAIQRLGDFSSAANRVSFVLRDPIVANPGQDFLYNDDTPMLVSGAVQYATGRRLFDFGRAALFDSLDFVNEEWMHQDATGLEMGGYGFRMRPMDMQKFGVLYLNGGQWNGRQLLPASWVASAWAPYIKSSRTRPSNDYGWFWWTYDYGGSWRFLVADGWKGQRIAVNRDHDLVVTMTGNIETQNEVDIFYQLMTQYVMPAVTLGSSGDVQAAIDDALREVHAGSSRVQPSAESRMIPSIAPKGQPIPFRP